METFKRHVIQGPVKTQDLTIIQENIARVLDRFTSAESSDGVLLEDLALSAGVENLVEHGLGRRFRGWFIADVDAGATIWRVSASTANLSRYLPLATSTAATVALWVF